MLENTLALALVNHEGNGDTFVVTKVRESNYASEYFLDDTELNNRKIRVNVSHTVPKVGADKESHLFRIDIDRFTTDGIYLRTDSAWKVFRTDNSSQDAVGLEDAAYAMDQLMTPEFRARLFNRES